MKCIFCKANETLVIDSRLNDRNIIKRRRECKKCFKRFNTFEIAEYKEIFVVKKNSSIAKFERSKIENSVLRALNKRKYSYEQLNKLIDSIEIYIRENFDKKIKSSEIGDIILQHLIEIDELAYVRFASVYNKFEDLDSFLELIDKIKKGKGNKK